MLDSNFKLELLVLIAIFIPGLPGPVCSKTCAGFCNRFTLFKPT